MTTKSLSPILALIAPAITFALLLAAVTAHAETPEQHAAHVTALIKAPLGNCVATPLATGGTVLVCVPVRAGGK